MGTSASRRLEALNILPYIGKHPLTQARCAARIRVLSSHHRLTTHSTWQAPSPGANDYAWLRWSDYMKCVAK